MDHKKVILDILLDKYEKRKEGSDRRVMIQCGKLGDLIPGIESDEYTVFLESMTELKKDGLIEFDWIRKGHIIDRIWLNLDNADKAYSAAKRLPMQQQAEEAAWQAEKFAASLKAEWIKAGLMSDCDALRQKKKLFGIWKQPHEYREKWLKALEYTDQHTDSTVTMRACSIKLYSDSKYFEREIKSPLASWIREHEPLLHDTDELEERDILAYVGIFMMPEVFEFCGNIKIEMPGGVTDFTPMKSGGCIVASCVDSIKSISLEDIKRITFIENRTNYSQYCLSEKTEDEFVVYHGGFYSPKHGKFFSMIYETAKNIPAYFWADIDYGGFQMYSRLRSNIFPTLKPYRMDESSFRAHKENGLKRDRQYLNKLAELLNRPEYSEFYPVIKCILQEGLTVEQESFLL